MIIKISDRIPNVTVASMTSDRPAELTAAEIFAAKKWCFLPCRGAYTPTCSQAHLPDYVVRYEAIKAKGVATIACLSVNDAGRGAKRRMSRKIF